MTLNFKTLCQLAFHNQKPLENQKWSLLLLNISTITIWIQTFQLKLLNKTVIVVTHQYPWYQFHNKPNTGWTRCRNTTGHITVVFHKYTTLAMFSFLLALIGVSNCELRNQGLHYTYISRLHALLDQLILMVELKQSLQCCHSCVA